MAITGDLGTMPISDLLQWAAASGTSGGLKVRHGKTEVRFQIKSGRLAGINTNDPASLLGQYLLARGAIDEDTLQHALARQEATGEGLPAILDDIGAVGRQEVERHVAAKAKEALFKMFEWDSGQFELDPALRPTRNMVRIDLAIEEVVLCGAQRQDELRRMKEVFNHPGLVLCRTDRALVADGAKSPMAKRLYDLVDGTRTFAEIVLLSRAAEYPATKFLFELYRRDVISVKNVQEIAPEQGTPEAVCELAHQLAERGDDEGAIDVLQSGTIQHPDDGRVPGMLAQMEASYIDRMYQSELAPAKVPVPQVERQEVSAEAVPANELFLLETIRDGDRDIREIVRIAPLHEIDVLRALRSLVRNGRVVLRGVDERTAPADPPEAAAPEPESRSGDLDFEIDRSLGATTGAS
jgi:hypothetical protein